MAVQLQKSFRPDPIASESSWETWLGPPRSWAIIVSPVIDLEDIEVYRD